MATVAARGPEPVGGQKLRRKAEAGYAFFDPHGGGGFFDHLVHRAFAVLPFGARSQPETGDIAPGTDQGAPVAPRLAGKVIWTTLIPAAVFAALVAFADYAG